MKKRIIKPALLICVFISFIGIVGFYACSKSGGGYGNTGGMGTGDAVSIQNFAFSVGTLTVTSGTTVTWTNNDATTHTVTADDGSFNSGNITPGSKFSHAFSTKGTVNYHCSIHPMMKASVVVN